MELIGQNYYFDLKNLILIYVLLLVMISILLKYNTYLKSRFSKYNFLLTAVVLLYVLFLIKILFFPISVFNESFLKEFWKENGEYVSFIQLVPLKSISSSILNATWIRLTIGNIFLLTPLPIFYGLYKINSKINYKRCLFLGILCSVTVEIIQLLINLITNYPNRVFDIDDIILNSLGILIGIFTFMLIRNNKSIYACIKRIILKEDKVMAVAQKSIRKQDF